MGAARCSVYLIYRIAVFNIVSSVIFRFIEPELLTSILQEMYRILLVFATEDVKLWIDISAFVVRFL